MGIFPRPAAREGFKQRELTFRNRRFCSNVPGKYVGYLVLVIEHCKKICLGARKEVCFIWYELKNCQRPGYVREKKVGNEKKKKKR